MSSNETVVKLLSAQEQAAQLAAMPHFEDKLKQHADHIRWTQTRGYTLVQQWIMVNRRFRGVTLSDQIGGFTQDPQLAPLGVWADPVFDDPDQPDVHPVNIVRPNIRANTNSCLQSNPAINVKPGKKSAELTRLANMAQLIIDHKRREAWRETSRARLFDAVQKNSAQFVETYYETNMCGIKTQVPHVPEGSAFEERSPEPQEETRAHEAAEPAGQILQEAHTEDVQTDPEEVEEAFEGYRTTEVGDVMTRQHSAFETVVDLIGGAADGLNTATWVQIHKLTPRAQVEADYPQFSFGAPREWCYALKCQHALMTNEWDVMFMARMTRSDASGFKDFELFEKREIFLHEDAYRNYRFPQDFEFVDGSGRTKFKARKGQTIAEAQKECWGRNYYGFRFVWIDDKLVDIVHPEDQPVNFRDCLTVTHWLPVSGCFWSVPHWDIVQFNDDLTNENTFWVEHNGSNVHSTVLFDSEKFDRQDFAYTHVGTKNGGLGTGQKMEDVAYVLPQSDISQGILAHIQWIMEAKDQISMVQPAQRGDMQKGETYGAQRQQLEQAFGMLTACVKSHAECLVDWAKHQLKLVQSRWTLEQFEAVASRFGEVWDESDVEEFAEMDIDHDLVIDYEPGSEMPESNFAKELKFFNMLPQLMGFLQLGMIPMPAAMELIRTIASYGDLDIDLTGLDTEEAIAQKRFHRISELCQKSPFETDWGTIHAMEGEIIVPEVPEQIDPMTGQPVPGSGQPAVTALDRIVEELLVAAEAMPNRLDDANIQIAFHTRRLKEELASPRTNYLLTACLEELIAYHKDAGLAVRQEQQLDAAAEQMPMMALANAAQQGADARQREQMAADGEAQFRQQQQLQGAQAEQQQQATLLNFAGQEADREFQQQQMMQGHKNALELEEAKAKNVARKSK